MSKELSSEYKKYTLIDQRRLLAVLAQQLKLPLLQIAKLSELEQTAERTAAIAAIAASAMDLVEYYQRSLGPSLSTTNLVPVSLGAIFHATAERLEGMAKLYQCDIDIELAGHFPPVLADATGLKAAMTSLASVMIEAQGQHTTKRGVITLAAHRSRWGLVAGAYSQHTQFSTKILRQGQALYGISQQPLNQVLASPGAGVFIADALLRNMSSKLHAARFHKLSGLAATFNPTTQLRLV